MELTVNAKLNYMARSFDYLKLTLDINFRKPGKIAKTKRSMVLCSKGWIGDEYENENEFYDDVINVLSNKEYIEQAVEQMVKKSMGVTDRQIARKSKEDEIRRLLKNNKFTVKVKIDWNKL